MPELAMVVFKVYDADALSRDDFLAGAAFPLSSLRSGFRHIALRNKSSTVIPNATLFVDITIDRFGVQSLS